MGLLPTFMIPGTRNDPAEAEKRRIIEQMDRERWDGPGEGPRFIPEEQPTSVAQQQPATAPVFQPASTNQKPVEAQQVTPQFQAPDNSDNGDGEFGLKGLKYDPATTPMPVYDRHGAPTGEVEGGGTRTEKDKARVNAYEDYKPSNHNSRLTSIGIGAGRGFARGGILGGLIGAVTNAIKPSADEEEAQRANLGRASKRLASDYGQAKAESDLDNDLSDRQAKHARALLEATKEKNDVEQKERADSLKNLDKYEALDQKNPTHASAIARARKAGWDIDPETWNRGNVQTAFDQESGVLMQRERGKKTWEPAVDAKGSPITTKNPTQAKLPDSFYTLDGADDKTVHSDAVAKAGMKDFSQKAEIDPNKRELLKTQMGMTDDDIKNGLELGTIKLSELVKDSQRDEARRYDAKVAELEGGSRKRLNLYHQAVDQTQTALQSSPIVSIAKFQQKYKEFYDSYSALYKKNPQAAEQKRADFFSTLRGFRLR